MVQVILANDINKKNIVTLAIPLPGDIPYKKPSTVISKEVSDIDAINLSCLPYDVCAVTYLRRILM